MIRCHRRPAFSLIELLIVMAILAVLMALGLAGVQKVRSTMGRINCQNNMRQMVLGVHSYEIAVGTFPQGTASSTLPAAQAQNEPYPGMSWMGAILPNIGQDVIWQQAVTAYSSDKNPDDSPPHPGDYVMKPYSCPGDSRCLQKQFAQGYTVALTSYLGINGTNLNTHDGIFYSRSQVRSIDILNGNGMSNTLMIGERPPSADLVYGWWYAGAGQWDTQGDPADFNSGSLDVTLGVCEINIHSPGGTAGANCPSGPYQFGPGQLTNISDQFHFWSLHSGGSNFAFADGHVVFLPYSSASLLPKMASILAQ